MYCVVCDQKLSRAIYSTTGALKACPGCSQRNGDRHVLHPLVDFGFTEHRVTEGNQAGIQSHCTVCRGGGTRDDGRLCGQADGL